MGKTAEELDQEFGRLCAQAGQLQFQIKILGNQLNSINQRMVDSSKKYQALKEAEASLKKQPVKQEPPLEGPVAPSEPVVEAPSDVPQAS